MLFLLPLDKLYYNPKYLNKANADLGASIQKYGLLSPIVVRPCKRGKHNGQFEIVAGIHRFLAVKALGWEKIPATIVKIAKKDLEEYTRLYAERTI